MKRWKVQSLDYIKFVDGRPHQRVGLPKDFKRWMAWMPDGDAKEMGLFATHDEAIAYAQEQAKTEALTDKTC